MLIIIVHSVPIAMPGRHYLQFVQNTPAQNEGRREDGVCSDFFLCRGIIKKCTPLGSKCTPHRPFVKWYRGVKRNRLHGDHFRIAVEPVIVKRYMKTLVNRGFYKKKPDTRFDTHCIKTGVQLWSGKRDSNPRLSAWEADALPLNYSRTS